MVSQHQMDLYDEGSVIGETAFKGVRGSPEMRSDADFSRSFRLRTRVGVRVRKLIGGRRSSAWL